MEKQNLHSRDRNNYFHATYRRHNIIKELLFKILFGISSWPRLVLEVFLRRNMGERYFTTETAVLIAIVLIGLPVYIYGGYGSSFWGVFWHVFKDNLTWYLFVGAFIYFSYLRWRDVKDLPSVFELRRFSLSSGIPFIFLLAKYDMRRIATMIEPAMTLLIGLALLVILKLPVGALIVVCSVIYSLSYFAAYSLGDDFIMDRMDEIICNRNLHASFQEGKDVRETDGFDFIGTRPADPEARERVMETFWSEEEVPEVR